MCQCCGYRLLNWPQMATYLFDELSTKGTSSYLCSCKSRTWIHRLLLHRHNKLWIDASLLSSRNLVAIGTVSVWSQECVTVYWTVNECTDFNLLCGTSEDSPMALRVTSASVWTLVILTKNKSCFPKDKLWMTKPPNPL